MQANKLALVAVAATILSATGCSHRESLREDFGKSTAINISSQVVNPVASAQAPEANAVDGQKMEKSVERYRNDKADSSRSALLSELGK